MAVAQAFRPAPCSNNPRVTSTPQLAPELSVGLRQIFSADAIAFVHQAKQRSGYAVARAYGRKLWQPSFHDRILRYDEATLSVARTFLRIQLTGLVNLQTIPFSGSIKFPVEQVMKAAVGNQNGQP